MATSTSLSRVAALAAVALVLGSGVPAQRPDWTKQLDADELELVGYAGHVPDSRKPKITAFFPRESYPVGGGAELRITDTAQEVSIQVLRAGTRTKRVAAHDVMTGSPVTALRQIGAVSGRRSISIRLGSTWASGTRPSCFVPARSASMPSRSCCRRRPGRPTTSGTTTATACPTPGTPRGARRAWPARSSTAACRRTTNTTTSTSSTGRTPRITTPTTSPTRTSTP